MLLRIGGTVEAPQEFSLADLKAMAKRGQITTHFCIQDWSHVAAWGGVAMRDILNIVKPDAPSRCPARSILSAEAIWRGSESL
jgi:methionine sulfoxide reductase catalytic subunit